ncbi:hypothetical protein GE09DRAFT_1093341 [Coniochaeta sp. 2T2.1]|nr:hypothetical protein GE09DRAFT_1093341 [Coniochaeta sp. 2T2.1]
MHVLLHRIPNGWAIPPSSHVSVGLCDSGGSVCARLGLDGEQLPDTPFFDPWMESESTPAADIFSLGSVFYTIQTGCWPKTHGLADRPEKNSGRRSECITPFWCAYATASAAYSRVLQSWSTPISAWWELIYSCRFPRRASER